MNRRLSNPALFGKTNDFCADLASDFEGISEDMSEKSEAKDAKKHCFNEQSKVRKTSNKKLNVLPPNPEETKVKGRFPSWLHRKLPSGNSLWETEGVLGQFRLSTVCEEAKCPNLLECWSKKTATFLVLGKECTRACGFCDIAHSPAPKPPEADEPFRIAASIQALKLKHVVITMVARDDLQDGGAAHLRLIIREIRKMCEGVTIEVLTSDFAGNRDSLKILLNEKPDIFNHNIETVRSLTPRVRHKATYERTLDVLREVAHLAPTIPLKSGLMVGLGESEEQVFETIQDLKDAGCSIITIGQYLQPSSHKLRVKAFITPDQFEAYASFGKKIGIRHMFCGPFVRSSYHAADFVA